MSNALCAAWQRVMANPSDAEALSQVRDQLDELMDHVDECADCLNAAQSSKHQEAVLSALGAFADEPSAEERAEYEALEQAWSDDEARIRDAVTSALLEHLPWDVRNEVATLGDDVDPLKLFLATNAVNLLVFSRTSDSGVEPLSLSMEGMARDGRLEVPADTIIREIARHAVLQPESARAVFDWMLRAAGYSPKLFLHFTAARSEGQVALRLDQPSLKQDLFVRWKPTPRLASAFEESELPAAASIGESPRAPTAAAPRTRWSRPMVEREDKAGV